MTDTENATTDEGSAGAQDGIAQGTYDLLRGRLETAGKELVSRANGLNARRLEAFGSAKLELLTTERVRTELNTIPRDIANVGSQLLMAYNAEVGVRSEVRPEDVFSVHHLEVGSEGEAGLWFSPNPEGLDGSALDDDQFRRDFEELHTYFSQTKLEQLYAVGQKLLAVFRTGQGEGDLRVFRWEIGLDDQLTYLDARGDRDHRFPPSQDVSWTLSTRADHINASHVKLGERVLIDPLGGSLVILLADGGGDGTGTKLLSDRLDHADQSLQDCTIRWASAGDLMLIDVLPYGEVQHRFYIVNLLVDKAVRMDALGSAFRQLPDGQGLIFPEGVYLKTGEMRTFDVDSADAELLEVVRSPNGEDVLYVFHERTSGRSILLPYNVVRQEVAAPIWCHGHTVFDDGTLVVFREEPESTRIHPMQIWTTPFGTDEWYAQQPRTTSDLDRIGNASLVSGIADALSLSRLIADVEPSTAIYTDLLMSAGRFIDSHHWSGDETVGNLAEAAHDIRVVAEQVIDEFERMQAVQSAAAAALAEAETDTLGITEDLRLSPPKTTEGFIDGLAAIRRQIGHLHTERDRRGIDVTRIDELIESTTEVHDTLAQQAAAHLAADGAFAPYHDRLTTLSDATPTAASSLEATEALEAVDALAESMDLVGQHSERPRRRRPSSSHLCARTSGWRTRRDESRAGRHRGKARCPDPERNWGSIRYRAGLVRPIDRRRPSAEPTRQKRAMTPLLVFSCNSSSWKPQDLEPTPRSTNSRLGETRSTEALTSRRQQLVDDRQQRADRLVSAATRTLDRVAERAQTMPSADDVNAFFAADPMVGRVRKLVDDLRELGEPVRADELQSQLGASRDRAVGHYGTAKTCSTVMPSSSADSASASMIGHVNSRSFRAAITSRPSSPAPISAFPSRTNDSTPTRELWEQPLSSETPELYRSAFLAGDLLLTALTEQADGEMTLAIPEPKIGTVDGAIIPGDTTALLDQVRDAVDRRLGEGYDRGVHDVDATQILGVIGTRAIEAGPLATPSDVRANAQVAWAGLSEDSREDMGRPGSGDRYRRGGASHTRPFGGRTRRSR